ncbi:phosphatidylinositol-3,4,5-trisphosphate 3-phosphatase [Achlya hypogyna]|uniref:Phosphatidylinositol-3,4,5-trisphosphate 3-phosphatase n=1 Tax=Achlya hypogyna TaxID=1202772 RepID=A0A1V9Y613_ACHHY|nr:phosphatidylinositol-3,4,5-trisphosphate 3-phosphatase [Achlya hypogyna]
MLKRFSEKLEKLRPTAPPPAPADPATDDADVSLFGETPARSGSVVSAETVAAASAAAAAAASGMYGLMKKAQSAATYAAKEGSAKAVVWKAKALEAADMDALQRRLNQALDSSGGPVDINTLNFTYVTENLIAMGFPTKTHGSRGAIRENPIDAVASILNTRHKGHYMIWNLSEEGYDYNYFDNQVLEFYFPGHPAPPLGLLFKICSSIESWTSADAKNIAVVHCLTGKGRTGTVLACYLAWTGAYDSPMEALEAVGDARRTPVEKLTIPSQRRYIQYFTNVLDGVQPRSMPLLLRRVIINSIPVFGARTTVEDDAEVTEEGCCPYVQIFKGGKLVFTTTWRDAQEGTGVRWASTSDGSVSFNVDCMLQGDVLVRCRHLTDSGQRISMFRAAFHTGYIPMGILRLTKAQLDGACQDPRFDKDFFVDLIFAPVQDAPAAAASDAPQSEGVTISEEDREAYDVMLSKDEKFWDEIAARKTRLRAAAPAHQPKKPTSTFSIVSSDEDIHVEMETSYRKGSWDDAKDQDLLAELQSTLGSQPRALALDDDLADMKELEKELGLERFLLEAKPSPTASVGVASTSVEPPSATSSAIATMDVQELLQDDFSDLGLSPPKQASAVGAAADFDFEDDEFAELEQYLSTLGPKGPAKE